MEREKKKINKFYCQSRSTFKLYKITENLIGKALLLLKYSFATFTYTFNATYTERKIDKDSRYFFFFLKEVAFNILFEVRFWVAHSIHEYKELWNESKREYSSEIFNNSWPFGTI